QAAVGAREERMIRPANAHQADARPVEVGRRAVARSEIAANQLERRSVHVQRIAPRIASREPRAEGSAEVRRCGGAEVILLLAHLRTSEPPHLSTRCKSVETARWF